MSEFWTPRSRMLIIALSTMALLASSGCFSETTGKEGNLKFSYATDDDFQDFNKPIAVGGRLELSVRDAAEEDRSAVELTSATSSDPSVLEVVSFSGDDLILEGKSDGGAEISVEAEFASTGEVKPDTVDMRAATPDNIELRHSCRDSGETYGIYQRDSQPLVYYELKLDDGRDVIGYGHYPVEASPENLLTLADSNDSQTSIRLDAADATGAAELASTIDGSVLDLELVSVSDFDGVQHDRDREVPLDDSVGILHQPTVVSVPVCQASADFSVGNLTPDICEVERGIDQDEVPNNRYAGTGWVIIRPSETGTCQYEVNYPDANDGAGVTETLSVEIVDAR